MSRQSKWEYLRKIYPRYSKASVKVRGQILDEFCANCGYHRKYAIRLLKGPSPDRIPAQRRNRRASYGYQVISVLSAIWEAAGYPWSVRLKALLQVGHCAFVALIAASVQCRQHVETDHRVRRFDVFLQQSNSALPPNATTNARDLATHGTILRAGKGRSQGR